MSQEQQATSQKAKSQETTGDKEAVGKKTYEGGCHCGKVRYRVALDLSQPVGVCNCSICSKTGTMLTFVPASDFELLAGEDALTDYQFYKKHIHHKFCKVCGIRSFAHGSDGEGNAMFAINARCLDGVTLDELNVTQWDGRSY